MEEIFADLHVHIGRSKNGKPIKITAARSLNFENIAKECAERKGINVVGIIDCASPYVIEDIEEFLKLYDQLAKIEGAAAHLYGDLFEFIIGVIYREFLPITSLEIGKLISISTGDRKEIDVYIKTTDKKIYFIEVK